jgi:hypothetical protein
MTARGIYCGEFLLGILEQISRNDLVLNYSLQRFITTCYGNSTGSMTSINDPPMHRSLHINRIRQFADIKIVS